MGNLLSQDSNEPHLTKASAESEQAHIQAKIENAVTRAKIEADSKVNFETITSKNVLFLQKNLNSIKKNQTIVYLLYPNSANIFQIYHSKENSMKTWLIYQIKVA